MKLIVGLGNPGKQYAGTRHNAGFAVIDEIARRASVGFESAPAEAVIAKWRRPDGVALLAKPLTFMNLSGQAVRALADFHKVDVADLLVIADDANLPLGRLRARPGGSSGGHNGFKSVAQHLGTDQFPRLRIGVGRGDGRLDLADHVLARFDPDERPVIEEAIGRAADAIEVFGRDGIAVVMNRFNAGPKELSETADDEKDSQS